MTDRITIRPVAVTGRSPQIYADDYYFNGGYFQVERKAVATITCEVV